MLISLIVAADEKNGMGLNNQLLVHLPNDLKYFKQTTLGHTIVMGRKTFDSIGRPLPKRINIIISRNADLEIEGCVVVASLEEAIEYARQQNETELFITGGGNIFSQAMHLADKIYLTRIHHTFEADTFFPALSANEFALVSSEKHLADENHKYDFTFELYERQVKPQINTDSAL